jgi:hypothetical protein
VSSKQDSVLVSHSIFVGICQPCVTQLRNVDARVTALFYTKHELGLRLAYWFGFAAVAGAFGGLLAFGIQHVHVGIANWRLLFIIEVWSSVAVCSLVTPTASRAFQQSSSVLSQ